MNKKTSFSIEGGEGVGGRGWGGEEEGRGWGGGEARNTKKASAIKRYLSKDQSISYWKELSKF